MDCHEFRKDGCVLARLYGRSELGTFTAFEKMVVTDAGIRRGYSSLECTQLVNTPWARQLQGVRVQQPIRTGMLYRILLGTTATGQKKAAGRQQRLLCLSLVEKVSTWGDGITDPCGSEKNHGQNWNMEAADYYAELYGAADEGTPLSMKNFTWAFTTPQLTRGYAFREIYCHEMDGSYPHADAHPWNGGNGEELPKYYVGPIPDCPISNCGGLLELADAQITNFAPPSVTTAYGQAKRSQVKAPRAASTGSSSGRGKKRSVPDSDDSDS